MRKQFGIGASFALAAALCMAQAARADTANFNDIGFGPNAYGHFTNNLYDGGLHLKDFDFTLMPKGLSSLPTPQGSNFLEVGSGASGGEPMTVSAYTGTPPANDGSAPQGADYSDGLSFNFWFLRLGLGLGNDGLTDMVTISGVRAGDCTSDCGNPTPVTFAVTDAFQVFSLTDFTDMASVTIGQQYIGNVVDAGWLALDDLTFTGYVAGGDNGAPPPPPPIPTGGVPEPGAWALMILGFGGVGAVIRRRRRAGLATA